VPGYTTQGAEGPQLQPGAGYNEADAPRSERISVPSKRVAPPAWGCCILTESPQSLEFRAYPRRRSSGICAHGRL
jgi:hypothetical protein